MTTLREALEPLETLLHDHMPMVECHGCLAASNSDTLNATCGTHGEEWRQAYRGSFHPDPRWVPLRDALLVTVGVDDPELMEPIWHEGVLTIVAPGADGAVRGVIEDALVAGGAYVERFSKRGGTFWWPDEHKTVPAYSYTDAVSLCEAVVGVLRNENDRPR